MGKVHKQYQTYLLTSLLLALTQTVSGAEDHPIPGHGKYRTITFAEEPIDMIDKDTDTRTWKVQDNHIC